MVPEWFVQAAKGDFSKEWGLRLLQPLESSGHPQPGGSAFHSPPYLPI